MQPTTSLAISLIVLFGLPQLAAAGPLAKTGRAIDNKTSGSTKSPPSSSSGSRSTTTHTRPPDHRDRDNSRGNYRSSNTSYVAGGSSAYCDGCESTAPRLRLPRPDMELGLAAQKVRGSDGSLRLDASMLFGRLGVYAAGDYYFEEITEAHDPKSSMETQSEYVRVNLFELAALGRVVDTKVFQADVHAGLGVAASSLFETLPGSAVGLTMRARASENVELRVEGRAMALKHSIRAYEGATGVQWRELWLGYRALQFDVGQVLQGPEAGVRFQF